MSGMSTNTHVRLRQWTVLFRMSGCSQSLAPGALVLLGLCGPVSLAHAQETEGRHGGIAEVVVSAQRRLEKLQDVPISAQVFNSETLGARNLTSLNALGQTVPSVQAANSGARTSLFFIRGIGSGGNQSFDQSVGVFIDDIYHGRSRSSAATFLDLDRVEILKGPQSTFFGNNAIAGAFNIVTRKPGPEFDAYTRALYGENGRYAIEGAIGGPVSSLFGVRAAATVSGVNGWIRNTTTGEMLPNERSMAGRITLAYTPTENFDATLKLEHSKYQQRGALYLQGDSCPPPAPFVAGAFCNIAIAQRVPIGIQGDALATNPGERTDLNSNQFVLAANLNEWGHTFTSVSGYTDYDFSESIDLDFTPARLLHAQVPERYHQLSQEIRVASETGGVLEYLVGAYFQAGRFAFRQDQSYFLFSPTISAAAPLRPLVPYLPLGQRIDFSLAEDSYAAFGSLSWNITERLKVTGGIRGTWVSKHYDDLYVFGTASQDYGGIVPLPANLQPLAAAIGLGPAYSPSGSRTDSAWLPSARVQYRFNPSVMAYVSFAKGFKSGGFNGADNTGNTANIPFAPEHVNAYEAGVKSEWFDDTVLVNVAIFHSDYTDLQVSQNRFTPAGGILGVVGNAAAQRSRGVELETAWAPGNGLQIKLAGTYLDSRYRDYANAPPTFLQLLRGQSVQDLTGRPTWFAPKWSGSMTGLYRMPLPGDYTLTTELTGLYAGRQFIDPNDEPYLEQRPYFRLDGRLSLETADGRWAFDLIGKNMTDRVIVTSAAGWPLALGSRLLRKEEPRNFALQARFNW